MGRMNSMTPAEASDALVVAGRSRLSMSEGSPEYCAAVLSGLKELWPFLEANAATFDRELALLREHQAWNLLPSPDAPYGSEDAMLVAELGASEATVAKRLTAAQEAAANAQPVMTHKEAGALGGRGNKASYPGNGLSRGNGARYWAGVLKRDHPAIYARLLAGDFPHVYAAALAAGIRTPNPETIELPRAIPAMAATLRRRLSDRELLDLIAALAGEEHA